MWRYALVMTTSDDDKKSPKSAKGDKHPVLTGLLVTTAVGAMIASNVTPHCSSHKAAAPQRQKAPQTPPPEPKPHDAEKQQLAEGWQEHVAQPDQKPQREV